MLLYCWIHFQGKAMKKLLCDNNPLYNKVLCCVLILKSLMKKKRNVGNNKNFTALRKVGNSCCVLINVGILQDRYNIGVDIFQTCLNLSNFSPQFE